MVIDIMINFITITLISFLSILPDGGTFPPEILSFISQVFAAVRWFDWIVPYSSFVLFIGASFSWFNFCFTWLFLMWVIRKIPLLNIR